MPNFTRMAIKASFWKLLNLRPLNKITVKDIVEDCGINRNSFYYHYEDLPSLIEEIIRELIEKTISDHPTIDTFEEGINVILNFVSENKKAVYHIYNSVDHGILEASLLEICGYAVKAYMESAGKDLDIDNNTAEKIIKYHQCELFGQIILWLNSGMEDDVLKDLHDFCTLSIEISERIIKREAEK